MLIIPVLVGGMVGKERIHKLVEGNVWLVLLFLPYAILAIALLRCMTWAELRTPVWARQAKRRLPIAHGHAADAERRSRWSEDRPLVEAAVRRGDAEFVYRLALQYEENWYINEAIELLRRAAELDPSGLWGAEARAKLTQMGQL